MKYIIPVLVFCVALVSFPVESRVNLPKKGGQVSLDFQGIAIKDVINAIAEITGKNFIVDDSKIRGNISIISPNPVTIEEAYEAFLMALDTKGFKAVDEGKYTRILKKSTRDIGDLELNDDYTTSGELITRVIALSFIDANKIRDALRRKVSMQGSMIAYGPTNSLFITDTASNVRRIEKMIQMMDRENYKTTTEVIPLRHSQAEDIAKKLQTIIQSQNKGRSSKSKINNIAGGENIVNILPDNRTNSLLVTATRKGLEEVLDLLGELDKPVLSGGNVGRVHIKRLKHADAEELSGLLSGLFGGASGKSSGAKKSSTGSKDASKKVSSPSVAVAGAGTVFEGEVRVGADPSTNSLIITASHSDYQAILPVIEELDQQRSQVFVEALIMEVNLSKTTDVGFSFSGAAGAAGFGGIAQSRMGSSTSPVSIGAMDGSKVLGGLASAAGLVIGGVGGGTFKLPGTGIKVPVGGGTLKALQKNGFVNVLSSPNILTMDNKKAEISIGKKVPVASNNLKTTDGGQSLSFSREPVELKLAVTPQINDGDSVTLEIEQKIQELEPNVTPGSNSITTSERSALTTVLAQDGQTITLGGLIKDRVTKRKSKVPLLGDIPLLGHLFRETNVMKEKINLMLFLTPHIIRDPKDLTRISVKKNNERRRFNKKNNIGENQALYDYDLDKGLNMAPKKSSRAQREQKRQRYNYEDYEANRDSVEEEPQSDSLVRRREQFKPSQTAEMRRARKVDSARNTRSTSGSGNPFADIAPPSSN